MGEDDGVLFGELILGVKAAAAGVGVVGGEER
jgi:hypothetical protein